VERESGKRCRKTFWSRTRCVMFFFLGSRPFHAVRMGKNIIFAVRNVGINLRRAKIITTRNDR